MLHSAFEKPALKLNLPDLMETVNILPPAASFVSGPGHDINDVIRTIELDPILSARLLTLTTSASHGAQTTALFGAAAAALFAESSNSGSSAFAGATAMLSVEC